MDYFYFFGAIIICGCLILLLAFVITMMWERKLERFLSKHNFKSNGEPDSAAINAEIAQLHEEKYNSFRGRLMAGMKLIHERLRTKVGDLEYLKWLRTRQAIPKFDISKYDDLNKETTIHQTPVDNNINGTMHIIHDKHPDL